jgi:hypothetical protein
MLAVDGILIPGFELELEFAVSQVSVNTKKYLAQGMHSDCRSPVLLEASSKLQL